MLQLATDAEMTITSEDLFHLLDHLDGRGFKAYTELRQAGGYRFEEPHGFRLFIDHVQSDPFAPPSRLRLCVPLSDTGLPSHLLAEPARRLGLCHGLVESVASTIDELLPNGRDDGRRWRALDIDRPGQQILQRSCLQIEDDQLTLRLSAHLPARGRRICGAEAKLLLGEHLPAIVGRALQYAQLDTVRLDELATTAADAVTLRAQLEQHDLVAFIADGAILPRGSGVDDRPLSTGAIPWQSPASLRVDLRRADGTLISGTGLPCGITTIVGGGFHGKSTLLQALRLGVYTHVPGDGRQAVITEPTAVAIRAEEGRPICGVDLTPFIGPLPFDGPTDAFSSDNASGATSQAAAIIEALEIGCRLLLIDEDTAATNFMIRDARMRELISDEREPITPFIDRVQQLAAAGVSTILVTGGSSDYLGVADTVMAMDAYRPSDVTGRARELVPAARAPDTGFPTWRRRVPTTASIDPRRGRRERSAGARDRQEVDIGRERIDLSAVTQLVDSSQTRALAQALLHAHDRHIDGRRPLAEICAAILEEVEAGGLDVLTRDRLFGDLAGFRRFELAAALNRLRSLQVNTSPGAGA